MSYNYVAPATAVDGERVVVKAGVPTRELANEITTLRLFGGRGAVRLIEADAESGLILLERIVPGELLLTVEDDDAATKVLADVLQRLGPTAPPDHRLPSVRDWFGGFARLRNKYGGATGPLPEGAVDRAEKLVAELLDSMSDVVVLHGDLHHWNILSAEREPWLAIDPQGVIGEREYEVGAWLRNPFPQVANMPGFSRMTSRRVDILAERLGCQRARLLGWGYCQAVLSAVWSLEDGLDDWHGDLVCADRIAALL